MADCKDIDAALDRLSSKIDGLNGRLNDLERKQKECCDKKDDKGDNLEGLLRRLSVLEKDMSIVGVFLSTYVEPVLKVMKELVPFKSDL